MRGSKHKRDNPRATSLEMGISKQAIVTAYTSNSLANFVHGQRQEFEYDLQPPNKLPQRGNKEGLVFGCHFYCGAATGCYKNPVDNLIEFIYESFCRPRATFEIQTRRSFSLFNSGRMKREILGRHSMAEESLRRASSRETGLTFPELRSSIRRTISASHAA